MGKWDEMGEGRREEWRFLCYWIVNYNWVQAGYAYTPYTHAYIYRFDNVYLVDIDPPTSDYWLLKADYWFSAPFVFPTPLSSDFVAFFYFISLSPLSSHFFLVLRAFFLYLNSCTPFFIFIFIFFIFIFFLPLSSCLPCSLPITPFALESARLRWSSYMDGQVGDPDFFYSFLPQLYLFCLITIRP